MDSDYFSLSQNTGSQAPHIGEAGTIVKIQMKNFMCHGNFEVNFNPRINFLCGKNGSGKSAIQTAIAVGLGGKTLATNRGTSLKALIKNDCNKGTVNIVVSNHGPLAYNPHIYGELIQVERSFTQSSQSYKIKNASGKVISSEKRELDKILAQFNIQTDNPVCILHQDVARNFLNTSDPKNKYKFYMKASRFDDISQLYNESAIRVHALRDTINVKFEIVKEAFKDVIETKKKLKILEDAKEKHRHRENLENELIWAKVNEENAEIRELQKRMELELLAKKRVEKKLNEGDHIKLKEKLRELKERIRQMDDMVKDANEKVTPAREDFAKKKEKLANYTREVSDANKSVKHSNHKYNSCMAEIENLTKNAPDMKLRREKLIHEIAELERNLGGIKAAESNFEHDRQQLSDTIDNASETLQGVMIRSDALKRKKSKMEEQIRQLTRNTSSLSVYGECMVRIVDEINRTMAQGKFEKKPVGPIGMHVKVRDPKWAAVVESILGRGFLSSFCVDNNRDLAQLTTILKTVCARYGASQPPIICSRFLSQMHNIASNETGTRQYTNLARALDIDHPVVANCLIDQQEIEAVLLIPTNEEAYQLLDEEHKVPRNCKKAFTMTGDHFIPAPNYKSYSNNKPVTHATVLQVKQEDLIRQLRNEISAIAHEINAAEEERRSAQEHEHVTRQTLRSNESELNNLRKQRRVAELKISQLKESVEPENQTNVGYLIEESKILQEQLEKEQERFEALKNEWEVVKREAEEAKTIFEGIQNTIAESEREKAPIQGEIQKLKSAIQEASNEADMMKQRIRDHEDNVNQYETELTELTEHLTEHTENASQICDRVDTQRGTQEINRELKSVESYLKKLEEASGGTFEQLQKNFSERQENFNTVQKDLDGLRTLVLKTQNAFQLRRKTEAALHVLLSTMVKNNFQIYLNERNFDGKLEFDEKAKTLEIKVKPLNEVDSLTKKHDTASLSGGEKSFSTVCFIMALWQEVGLPFHFLDEFDVFMDGINRRIVMDLLISYAKGVRQQFVFLTPHDMSSVTDSSIVTIQRLEAPRD